MSSSLIRTTFFFFFFFPPLCPCTFFPPKLLYKQLFCIGHGIFFHLPGVFFLFYFLPCLQFGSDAGRALNLAQIPQYFDLELYAEHRLQKVTYIVVFTPHSV